MGIGGNDGHRALAVFRIFGSHARMFRIDAEPLYARILVFCGWLKRNGSPLPRRPGPVVKWYYAAFALLSQEFDSPQVHHIELVASLGASPLASAGSFARKLKGFLKSISSRPAARRRFTNEIYIARRAMSRFFSFAFGERQSEILLNCRCAFPFSITIKQILL